jgi:hypothetical protein
MAPRPERRKLGSESAAGSVVSNVWRPPGLPRKPLQQPRDLRRMPMTAPRGRWNSALVKRRSNAIQARYPGRPQLRDDWR